jgi:hypothetical protein
METMPQSEQVQYCSRGIKTRLIGVAMIALGVLDSLLTLRGGFPAEQYLIVIAVGFALFAIGSVRSRRDSLRRMKNV